jgi:hypothetical protein
MNHTPPSYGRAKATTEPKIEMTVELLVAQIRLGFTPNGTLLEPWVEQAER